MLDARAISSQEITMAPRIEDYALIGDCKTAALVSVIKVFETASRAN